MFSRFVVVLVVLDSLHLVGELGTDFNGEVSRDLVRECPQGLMGYVFSRQLEVNMAEFDSDLWFAGKISLNYALFVLHT